jgi:hypothetical protein
MKPALALRPWLLAAIAWGLALHAWATDSAQHPWVTAPPGVATGPTAYFTNLSDGDQIATPYLLKFGLSRYGLSAISAMVPNTGHHHLLVNRDLPLDFTQPLPFNDQYIHFGKGQMETVLEFPPGSYTLRLLLADSHHLPLFIYSDPVRITVTAHHANVSPASLIHRGVQLLSPAPGSTVAAPFRMQFHASGLNVSHAAVRSGDVGHFRLLAERSGHASEQIDFNDGATEAWLKPPAGDYRFVLELIGNTDGRVMARTPAVPIHVEH